MRAHVVANATLLLLYNVPCFMRQVAILAWSDVDVHALHVAQGVELRRLRRVVVDAHAVHAHAREAFDSSLESRWQFASMFSHDEPF